MPIALRRVHDSDLPVFFRQTNDPESLAMAAFTPEDPTDRDAFDDRWSRIRASSAVVRTILVDGDVVGSAAVYGEPGEREVTYWVDRAYWGRGIATQALTALLVQHVGEIVLRLDIVRLELERAAKARLGLAELRSGGLLDLRLPAEGEHAGDRAVDDGDDQGGDPSRQERREGEDDRGVLAGAGVPGALRGSDGACKWHPPLS